MRFPFAVLLATTLCVAAGCGGKSKGPERAAVSGTVTLDGNNIAIGSITFVPAPGTKGMTAGGRIEDGVYSIDADKGPVVGNHVVEIRAARKTGRQIPAAMGEKGAMMDELVEGVPAQYNERSTLTVDIKSGTNENTNFPLSSR